MTPKFFKRSAKALLSSENWFLVNFRKFVSKSLFLLSVIVGPFYAKGSNLLVLYGCIFAFNPERLAAKIETNSNITSQHLVLASRAFFEIAFARGELFKIFDLLKKITKIYPYLFAPWKLLHYSYYFTKSWDSLQEINNTYENFRRSQIEIAGFLEYDVILGDHVTSSIGHSQILFDFEILYSLQLSKRPKIALCYSSQDKMSKFYRELIPDVIESTINVDLQVWQSANLANFLQDSFPFLVTKKYFSYQEERGRAKYLASWAATGAKAFTLTGNQRAELDLFLRGLNLAEDDWYVVLHVREGSDNSIRNADINTYYDAINSITSRGGWVFRIGDASMTPLRKNLQNVVDLPFSSILKPAFIDLYLLATARFVICTASGPSDFPFYFNIPRLITNWPVMYALFGTPNDICVPVSYYCSTRNSIVTLEEQLNSVIYESNSTLQSLKSVRSIQNSSHQIEHAAIEMIKFTMQCKKRDKFSPPSTGSLHYRYKDNFWFMGSIAKSFLEENPTYLCVE